MWLRNDKLIGLLLAKVVLIPKPIRMLTLMLMLVSMLIPILILTLG